MGVAADLLGQRGYQPWALAALALLVTVTSFHVARHYLVWGSNWPGPPVYPFIGFLPSWLRHRRRFYDWLADTLQARPGHTFRAAAPGGLQEVYTADPASLQHILKDHVSNYPKGEELAVVLHDLLGRGIFNSDGETWRGQRKAASLEFSNNSLRGLVLASLHEEIEARMLPTLDAAAEQGRALDLQDVLLRLAFDNICRVGFGAEPACLRPDLPAVPFEDAFGDAVRTCMLRMMLPRAAWQALRALNWGPERRMRQAMQAIHAFVEDVIQCRKVELRQAALAGQEGAKAGQAEERHADLLSRFMLLHERSADTGDSVLASDTYLRDITTNFILAGRDTSALTLTWLFWYLAQHPEIESRIVAELEGIIGERGSSVPGKEQPMSFNELKRMPYMHAAVNEVLRLVPAVPIDFREALQDDILPGGTRVAKGARVNYVLYAMGRMRDVWGADAAEFKPERWIGSDGCLNVESPFKFAAFNAGPRTCLGRDMAYMQIKCVAASILRRYSLRPAKGQRAEYGVSLTLAMKDGYHVSFERRSPE